MHISEKEDQNFQELLHKCRVLHEGAEKIKALLYNIRSIVSTSKTIQQKCHPKRPKNYNILKELKLKQISITKSLIQVLEEYGYKSCEALLGDYSTLTAQKTEYLSNVRMKWAPFSQEFYNLMSNEKLSIHIYLFLPVNVVIRHYTVSKSYLTLLTRPTLWYELLKRDFPKAATYAVNPRNEYRVNYIGHISLFRKTWTACLRKDNITKKMSISFTPNNEIQQPGLKLPKFYSIGFYELTCTTTNEISGRSENVIYRGIYEDNYPEFIILKNYDNTENQLENVKFTFSGCKMFYKKCTIPYENIEFVHM